MRRARPAPIASFAARSVRCLRPVPAAAYAGDGQRWPRVVPGVRTPRRTLASSHARPGRALASSRAYPSLRMPLLPTLAAARAQTTNLKDYERQGHPSIYVHILYRWGARVVFALHLAIGCRVTATGSNGRARVATLWSLTATQLPTRDLPCSVLITHLMK